MSREMSAYKKLGDRAVNLLKKFGVDLPPDSLVEGSPSILTRSDQTPDARFSPKGASRNQKYERVGGFRIESLGDLLSEPPDEARWLVGELLPVGGISIMGARPKVGKSTLARNLAFLVARGTSFLDMPTQQGPVVYLALEEKRSEVQLHFRQMGATAEPIYIHFGIAPQQELTAIRELIARYKPVLVIIDPLLRLVRVKDSNAYGEVTQALEPYVQLARSTGCHLMFVHHLTKHERTGGEGILGSTAIFGAVDTAIMLNSRERIRTIESIQRYGQDLAPTILVYDRSTGLITRDRTSTDHQHDALAAKVCAVLAQGSLNEAEIRGALGGDQTEAAKALRRLVEQGIVIRSGAGRKGSPYQYQLVGMATHLRTTPSPSDPSSTALCDQTGWPACLEGLGTRATGEFFRCVQCGAGTWSRYGDTPLCRAHANPVAGKLINHGQPDIGESEVEEGGDDDAGMA